MSADTIVGVGGWDRDAFAQRLELASKRRGLGANEINERVTGNPTSGAFSRWRQGLKPPMVETAVKIAEALDVSLDWLLTGEGPMDRRVVDLESEKNDAVTAAVLYARATGIPEAAISNVLARAARGDDGRPVEAEDLYLRFRLEAKDLAAGIRLKDIGEPGEADLPVPPTKSRRRRK